MTAAISFEAVNLWFDAQDGGALQTLRDFNMEVGRGEFVALVGPTGCGKSTTLNLITGLLRPTSGTVRLMGAPVTGIDRRVGFVFQADALFVWRTVIDNVVLGPLYRGVERKVAYAEAARWLEIVGLTKFARHYPHQLSGGMRKRVALAQTFINKPEILLMDEPFSALDVQTRMRMQDELLGLWSSTGASVVFVTHDLEEAIALADHVVVLTANPGSVKKQFRVTLDRPRNVNDIRFDDRFRDLHEEIWEALREEVARSYALQRALVHG